MHVFQSYNHTRIVVLLYMWEEEDGEEEGEEEEDNIEEKKENGKTRWKIATRGGGVPRRARRMARSQRLDERTQKE